MIKDLGYYRRRQGISQEELGEKLGVPKANISAWERGMREVPLKHLDTIAEALSLSEEELQQALARSTATENDENDGLIPEIIEDLAMEIYNKAFERAALRQKDLSAKFLQIVKTTYSNFSDEEYADILRGLLRPDVPGILIRAEISRMTSNIAFLAHKHSGGNNEREQRCEQ